MAIQKLARIKQIVIVEALVPSAYSRNSKESGAWHKRLYKPEPKTFIVITAGKLSATVQAGDGATNPVHP
jgi:hypothetical protein